PSANGAARSIPPFPAGAFVHRTISLALAGSGVYPFGVVSAQTFHPTAWPNRSASAFAVAYRSDGNFDRAICPADSTAGGTVVHPTGANGGGVCLTWAARTASTVGWSNGNRPVSISYSMTPTL